MGRASLASTLRSGARWLSGAFTAVAVLLAETEARAADAPGAPPSASTIYNAPDWAFGSPVGEAALAAVTTASLATFLLPQRRGTWGPYSSRAAHASIGTVSDFTGALFGSALLMTSGYLLESAYYRDGGVGDPYARALRTTLIDLEAVTFTSGLVFGIKRLAGRCRPRAWKEGKCGNLDTDYDAFPSGHTAPVAALAGARFALALNSSGNTALRYTAFGIAEGATLFTAFMRVAAGAHSWEDVVGGWIIGHGAGLLIGYAHPMVDLENGQPSETSQPLNAVFSWSGTF